MKNVMVVSNFDLTRKHSVIKQIKKLLDSDCNVTFFIRNVSFEMTLEECIEEFHLLFHKEMLENRIQLLSIPNIVEIDIVNYECVENIININDTIVPLRRKNEQSN